MKQTLRLLCNVYNNNPNLFLDTDGLFPKRIPWFLQASEVYGIDHEWGYNPETGEEVEWFELDMSENCLSQFIFTKVLS